MAFALLEDLYGVGRTEVLLGKDKDFSAEESNNLEEIVQKTCDGLPLQYATERALFCGRYFRVSPDVLIPRPETEALTRCSDGEGPSVLDLGTGSGCIAITIALEHPDWTVEAWDISEGALAVARENARRLGAENVVFRQCDMLTAVPTEAFSLIVSNPPYICRREAAEMEAHVVDHEPHTALFVPDDDPLLFYRAICATARRSLRPGGHVVVECNRAYTDATAALFKAHGLAHVQILDDCFGTPRFIEAWQP